MYVSANICYLAHETNLHTRKRFQWTARISNDQRGAVLVLGLFMGIFLVALLYHVCGVGRSAIENQLSQNAVDSLTYSAATVKARGMNTIALINLVMATVLAVLVAIRLVEMLIVVAIAAVSVACVFSGGAACGAVAPLAKAQHELHSYSENMEDTVHSILRSLEEVADAVNVAVPILAEAEAVYISKKEGQPISTIGFVWPIVEELPTEKGTFNELCDQAGKQVVRVSTFFLPGNLPEKANETVGELLGSLASKFTKFFCGGGPAPKRTQRFETAYPTASDETCDNKDAAPYGAQTDCASTLCEHCTTLACNACGAKMDSAQYKKGRWLFETWQWVEQASGNGKTQVVQQWPTQKEIAWLEENPCKEVLACGNRVLCESEERFPDSSWGAGATKVVQRKYRKLLSCIVEEETQLKTPKKVDGKKWPKPRVIKKDATRDSFRVWGIGLGANQAAERLADVGRLYGEHSPFAFGTRFGMASAEFLSPTNDLWHLHWYSRLIRFRMPSKVVEMGECRGKNAESCKQVSGQFDKLKSLAADQIVH